MAKLKDLHENYKANAERLAVNTRKVYDRTVRTGKMLLGLLKLAIKTVWGACKTVVFVISNISVFAVVLAILIVVYGVITVIVADQLQFCLNPDEMSAKSADTLEIEDDSQVYLAMAQALDRDKIAKYYKENTAGFQQWYENYRITTQTTETPAKMLDLYVLVNEIYNRPEINSPDYKFSVNMANVLGSMKLESRPSVLGLGSGDRLFNSEIEFYVNGSGYCDPLGCPAGIWSSNLDITGYSHIGCTYICEDEYPALASEQRAIYGGGGNITAGNARYITYDALSRRDNQLVMNTTDDSFKYLNTIRLSNSVMSHRGFTTWIPDALYTFAYVDRISTEGRNRDTHNYSSAYYDSGNIAALEEFQEQLGLTREQCGVIASMLYCGDRHFHSNVDALPNYEGINELSSDTASICAAVSTILYLEGYLDKIVMDCNGDLSVFYNNYVITEKIYGPYDLSGTPTITSLDPNAAYMQCLKAIEAGTTNYDYPEEWIAAYKKMQNCYGSICQLLGMSEGIIRIQYGMSGYVVGNVFLDNLESVVNACYNYQDSKGNYIFRLYDIDTSIIDNKVHSGVVSGGFMYPVTVENSYISSLYGPRWGTTHKGIDITGGNIKGTDVVASMDGTVITAVSGCTHDYPKNSSCGCGGGYGNYVEIDHGDGFVTKYAHMTQVTVTVGQKVKQGAKVGTVGNTGHSTGAHLHFEILLNGQHVDPDKYIPEIIAQYWKG